MQRGLNLRFDEAHGRVRDSHGWSHPIAPVTQFLKTHTSRMIKVLDFEQNQWVKPALEGTMAYDLVFGSFDETNRQAILDQVCKAAREKMDLDDVEPQRTRRTRPAN